MSVGYSDNIAWFSGSDVICLKCIRSQENNSSIFPLKWKLLPHGQDESLQFPLIFLSHFLPLVIDRNITICITSTTYILSLSKEKSLRCPHRQFEMSRLIVRNLSFNLSVIWINAIPYNFITHFWDKQGNAFFRDIVIAQESNCILQFANSVKFW